MTIDRFDQYSSQEKAVFNRFLNYYANQPSWEEVKEHLGNYVAHPDGTEDYDIRCTTERVTSPLTFRNHKISRSMVIYVLTTSQHFNHRHSTRSLKDFESALSR